MYVLFNQHCTNFSKWKHFTHNEVCLDTRVSFEKKKRVGTMGFCCFSTAVCYPRIIPRFLLVGNGMNRCKMKWLPKQGHPQITQNVWCAQKLLQFQWISTTIEMRVWGKPNCSYCTQHPEYKPLLDNFGYPHIPKHSFLLCCVPMFVWGRICYACFGPSVRFHACTRPPGLGYNPSTPTKNWCITATS